MQHAPTEEPDDDLTRDVYAHFGLCMYIAQVFETGLINVLTTIQHAKSVIRTPESHDALYAKNESLTFGNLVKELSKHRFVPVCSMKRAALRG